MTDKLKEAAKSFYCGQRESALRCCRHCEDMCVNSESLQIRNFIAGATRARKEALEMLKALPAHTDADWYVDYLEQQWNE